MPNVAASVLAAMVASAACFCDVALRVGVPAG